MSKLQQLTKILLLALFGLAAGCGGGGGSDAGGSDSLLSGDIAGGSSSSGGSTSTSSGSSIEHSFQPGDYFAFVEWQIPTTRENGDPLGLSEIAGYEIMITKVEEGSGSESIVLTDQNTSEYTLEGLSPGRYEIRIAVFDTDNVYSDYSQAAYADIGL